LVERDRELAGRADSTFRLARALPALAAEGAARERDVTVAAQLFTTLQQRYDEARLVEASSVPAVQIVDTAADPQRPAPARGAFILLMSFLTSLGLGLFGAIVLNAADPRIRNPEGVSKGLGLRIIGAVPHIRGGERATRTDVPQAVEALRTVRVRLQHLHGSSGSLALTVTSPGSGEGKSLVTANLALAFAYAGCRTVLVDADVRRGSLHRLVGLTRRPGLTDFLSGDIGFEQVVQPTMYPLVSFVGSGTRKHEAPELLSSVMMEGLMDGLRSNHDVVLVDSAPLGAGADPYVLAGLTTNLLLVFRSGVSDMELAQAKLEAFNDMSVRVLGAVLNDVRASGAYRYYGYQVPAYAAHEEAEAVGVQKPVLGVFHA
jgi:capsular exopolysaccharide synthesis family protein